MSRIIKFRDRKYTGDYQGLEGGPNGELLPMNKRFLSEMFKN